MSYLLNTILVQKTLASMGIWRPIGTNPEWQEQFPFVDGISNKEIWAKIGLNSSQGKDGIVKGEETCIDNLSGRGCRFDGVFDLGRSQDRFIVSEFKLGGSVRFNGNDAIDITTGSMQVIEDLVFDLHEAPIALQWISTNRYTSKTLKGVHYTLWSFSLTRFIEHLLQGSILLPRGCRPHGSRFYNPVTEKWEIADDRTPQSPFFIKVSRRKYETKKHGKRTKEYVTLRLKPSAIHKCVKRNAFYIGQDGNRVQEINKTLTHKQTREWLQNNGVMVSTPLFVANDKGVHLRPKAKERLLRDLKSLYF